MENIDKDLQEIIDIIAEAIITGKKQLLDGFQYTDIFAFIPVLSKIPEAIKDANKAWDYLQDMTDPKRQDLIDAVLAKLNDASEDTRMWARRITDSLASNYMLIKMIMDKAKESKGPEAPKSVNPNPPPKR